MLYKPVLQKAAVVAVTCLSRTPVKSIVQNAGGLQVSLPSPVEVMRISAVSHFTRVTGTFVFAEIEFLIEILFGGIFHCLP